MMIGGILLVESSWPLDGTELLKSASNWMRPLPRCYHENYYWWWQEASYVASWWFFGKEPFRVQCVRMREKDSLVLFVTLADNASVKKNSAQKLLPSGDESWILVIEY